MDSRVDAGMGIGMDAGMDGRWREGGRKMEGRWNDNGKWSKKKDLLYFKRIIKYEADRFMTV
jgi:hypothetical protein